MKQRIHSETYLTKGDKPKLKVTYQLDNMVSIYDHINRVQILIHEDTIKAISRAINNNNSLKTNRIHPIFNEIIDNLT